VFAVLEIGVDLSLQEDLSASMIVGSQQLQQQQLPTCCIWRQRVLGLWLQPTHI